ncbi:hypothetical protein H8A99_34260 [Bradyrhizobium sp. Arg68]|uniref:hypothetical protein n=1 Tax=Bradyrhizobium ivorense TaxID=2511166 RepID=UPI001E40364A|nr:hypothetical protein [Bradyrhizobium ivorense]MCC8941365.1 hypothetical protein [Bradyrhizobium ivorense]
MVLEQGYWKIMPQTNPLDPIIEEIERAISLKLGYLALTVALTIPSICGALENPSGTDDGGRYRKWYKQYVGSKFKNLTPADCYSLRNGVVHQGRFGTDSQKYDRVVFVPPTDNNMRLSGSPILRFTAPGAPPTCLLLELREFCEAMIAGAREWFATAQTSPVVQRNMERLVKPRPDGIPMFDVGPVIW